MSDVMQSLAFVAIIAIVGLAFWLGTRPSKPRKGGDNFGESHNRPGEASGAADAGFHIQQ